MKRMMAAAVIMAIAAASPARAERRRAVAPPAAPLSIAFVDTGSSEASLTAAGSEAWLDFDTVSHQGRTNERSTRIRQQFGIRITRDGSAVSGTGTASITARLESWDGRATYRLDGRPLTIAALLVDAHAEIGATTVHTLDIEIPVSAAEGPLATAITWEVTDN